MKFEPYIVIGNIARTHSIKGEVIVKISLQEDFDSDEPVLIIIDGLPVPFFIVPGSLKYRNDTEIQLLFKGILDEKDAAKLVGLPFAVFESTIEEDDQVYLDQMVGYEVTDVNLGPLGKITQYLDIANNPLFEVEFRGKLYLFPANEDFFVALDDVEHTLEVSLPEGIFDAQD